MKKSLFSLSAFLALIVFMFIGQISYAKPPDKNKVVAVASQADSQQPMILVAVNTAAAVNITQFQPGGAVSLADIEAGFVYNIFKFTEVNSQQPEPGQLEIQAANAEQPATVYIGDQPVSEMTPASSGKTVNHVQLE